MVQIGALHDGTLTYLIDHGAAELPPVRPRDLLAAWDSAREAAGEDAWGVRRLFRFPRRDGTVTDLALTDMDAACWAGAVDRTVGIGTAYGLSVCLRLLALVDLLACAAWAASFCEFRRDGASLAPALVEVAATAPMTEEAGFDEPSLRARLALLPRPSTGAPHEPL